MMSVRVFCGIQHVTARWKGGFTAVLSPHALHVAVPTTSSTHAIGDAVLTETDKTFPWSRVVCSSAFSRILPQSPDGGHT